MATRKHKPLPPALDERAMLVYLSIGHWSGKKADTIKTDEVLKGEHAASDSGEWWTRVIPKHAVNPIVAARSRARAKHFELTLPWQDDGFRILPAAMFLKYTEAMREARTEFESAVKGLIKEYPNLVAGAAKRLGGLFKSNLFPSATELSYKFPYSLRFNPLPRAQDFRVDLGAEANQEIAQNIQQQVEEATATAMKDLWARLHDGVNRIAERLNDPKGIFRDSLIENVVDLCEMLPDLNITGNAELETARQEVLKKLAKQEPEVLRTNKAARASTAKNAQDILKKMEQFVSKKGK